MKRLVLALLVLVGTIGAAPVQEQRALQTKAGAGDANAQFALAEAYRAGRGVKEDPEAAITWYRRAAEQGHIRASEELGFALFARGDRREAMPYIEKAAARGDARALYVLGTAHFNGDYTTRDWPRAYALTVRAASAGLPAAKKNLDLMDQYLLPPDKAKADQILATLPPVRTIAQREASIATKQVRIPSRGAAALPATKVSRAPPARFGGAGGMAPAGGAAAVARGAWKAQLGAFASPDRARDQWASLSAKVPRLASYEQRVVPFQSVQRLQVWGIGGKADADALCRQVRNSGAQCFVVAP